ncbi:1287_t:CDS:1, partial [Racocetra fulgida]
TKVAKVSVTIKLKDITAFVATKFKATGASRGSTCCITSTDVGSVTITVGAYNATGRGIGNKKDQKAKDTEDNLMDRE